MEVSSLYLMDYTMGYIMGYAIDYTFTQAAT